jgi:hypothetical protein
MKSVFVSLCLSPMIGLAGCISKPVGPDAATAVPPKLLKPVIHKIWIPPEIKNGGLEWTEGHFMYRIEKETSWSR